MSTIYDALMKAESDRLKRLEGRDAERRDVERNADPSPKVSAIEVEEAEVVSPVVEAPEVEIAAAEAPVVEVPEVETRDRVDAKLLPVAVKTHDTAEVTEQLYPLYQSLASVATTQGMVLTFVGAGPNEGVSTLTREFAKLSGLVLGHRVLLLDGDHGNGRHGEHLGVEVFDDFAAVAEGRKKLSDAIVTVSQNELSFGAISLNGTFTARIAARPEFVDIFQSLRKKFDLILIDAPPVRNSSEALAYTKVSDGTVLVLQAEATRWQVAKQAKESIERAGGKVIGAILNRKQHHIPDFIYKRL